MTKGYQEIETELNKFEVISVKYTPRVPSSGKKIPKRTRYDNLLTQINAAILSNAEANVLSPEMKALATYIHALNTTRQQLLDFVSRPQPLYELIEPLVESGAHQNDWTQEQWEEEAKKIDAMLDLLQEKPQENSNESDSAQSPFVFMVSKIKGVFEKNLSDNDDSYKLLNEAQKKIIFAKKEKKVEAVKMLNQLGMKKRILGELPKKKDVIKTIPALGAWDRFLNFFGIETRKTKAKKHLLGEVTRMRQMAKKQITDLDRLEKETSDAVEAEMKESISKLEIARAAALNKARSIREAKQNIERLKKQSLGIIGGIDSQSFNKLSTEVNQVLSLIHSDMEKSLAEIQKIQQLRTETSKIESENDEMQADIASNIEAIKEDLSTDSLTYEQIDEFLSADLSNNEDEILDVENQYHLLMQALQNLTRIRNIQEKSIEEAFERVAGLRAKLDTVSLEISLSNSEEAVKNAIELNLSVESAERIYNRGMDKLHRVNEAMLKISASAERLLTASKEKLLVEYVEKLEKSIQYNKLSLETLEMNRDKMFSILAEVNTRISDVPMVEDSCFENEVFRTWVEKSDFTQKVDAIFDAQKRSAEKSYDLQEKISKLEAEATQLQQEIAKSLELSWGEYFSSLYREHLEGEKPENITVDLKMARVQDCIEKQAEIYSKVAEHRAKNETMVKKIQEIESLRQEIIEEFERAKKAKDELAVLLAQSECLVVYADNQKRNADAMVSAAVEAVSYIDKLDTQKDIEPLTLIPSVLSSGLSKASAAVSDFFDQSPVLSEKDLARQENRRAEKARADIHRKFDKIDTLVDKIVSLQQKSAESFGQGVKVQEWRYLITEASDVLASLHDNKGNYEWALIQAIVPAVMVIQRTVNQSIQKMCESSDLSVIQKLLSKMDSLSINELQTLKDQMIRMTQTVSKESIEEVQKYLQWQQFSGTDIHILKRERTWLSANIRLYGMSDSILRTEEERLKAVHAMGQIDEVIAMHEEAAKIIAVAVNLDSSLQTVECKLQALRANMPEAKGSVTSSPVLNREPYGIWAKEKNHSVLFQPPTETAPQPSNSNLVRRALHAFKMAVIAFTIDISTWFSTLIENVGAGLL